MNEINRRDTLGLLAGGVILAGAGVSLWPQNAEALPEALPNDRPASGNRESAARALAQAGSPSSPPRRPPHRPPHRPPSWHRRRRRWVCWWHRGRRHCGWRWR